jgi:hypothetical protein
MSYTPTVRTFRDGSIAIKDNDSPPNVCTVVCDEGDLRWRSTDEVRIIRCRGQISDARPGDVVPLELSCTFKWAQLIQNTVNASDPITPYEIIENEQDEYVSHSNGVYCLLWEFTVVDPAPTSPNSELISFERVYKETLECAEGEENNTVSFSGKSLTPKPTITRVTP